VMGIAIAAALGLIGLSLRNYRVNEPVVTESTVTPAGV
jgi:hypothetical protein